MFCNDTKAEFMRPLAGLGLLVLVPLITACAAPLDDKQSGDSVETEMVKRAFSPTLEGRWIGNGISYGPYRDGESPGANSVTSQAHVLEDLQLLTRRWNLIRLYGADAQSRNVLEVIRKHALPVRVMQGAWISGHESAATNQAQIATAIELANEFPEIVVAVNVGNEIFVDWSWHKVDDMDVIIDYIRQVRSSVRQPVTVNDDYNFWNKPQAARIAAEVDFIGLHAYAFWNNIQIDQAFDWTVKIYTDIQSRFPDHAIAYTETGWPTSKVYDDSYEGKLIGDVGEAEQERFFDAYDDWVDQNRIVSLYFEAFDEKWKGGDDGEQAEDKAEKHWGLYRSDRTPKAVLK